MNSRMNSPDSDFTLDDDTLVTLAAFSIMTDHISFGKKRGNGHTFVERKMSSKDKKKNDDDAAGVECALGAMDCHFLSSFGHPLQLRIRMLLCRCRRGLCSLVDRGCPGKFYSNIF